MNIEAVFSDETENYVRPFTSNPGDTVYLRLRVARSNVSRAFLRLEGSPPSEMTIAESDELFDYFEGSLIASDNQMRYYFALYKDNRVYFYNKRGLSNMLDAEYNFRLIPGFDVPEWAHGAVMYQIFTDRFNNGDASNDPVNFEYLYLGRVAKHVSWGEDVSELDVCNFYGGDLRGVMDKMDYLKELGVDALYLNPIFVSPSNHKYDIQDYDHVDPHYGKIVNDGGSALSFEKLHNRHASKYKSRVANLENLEASDRLFAEFVALAHEKGLKVILDGVFNHCGSFNKWMDKAGFYTDGDYPPGAYRDENSPYRDYFLWYNSDWPNNDCYDGWWGNETLPKLNYETSPALTDYILGVAKKWVSPPYNADGWRLDVAADLGRSPAFNHKFWAMFRNAVKSANPNAIILAEHYGDVSPWLNGKEWDTVMNYDAFMKPLTWFLTGLEIHSDEYRPELKNDAMTFERAMRYHMAQYSIHSLQTSMNELSNHDHSRFLTRTNCQVGRFHTAGPRAAEAGINKNVMMEAVVFQMTWPGAPTVYYGDEAGVAGWTDPDARRCYPWGNEDPLLMECHRVFIALHKRYTALRGGSVEFLLNDYGFISFGRFNRNEKIAVAINNNAKSKDVVLPVWKIGCASGAMRRVAATFDNAVRTAEIRYAINGGTIRLTIPANGAVVLVHEA
jgi:alpha-glucosidase